ncbi:MAG: helix-turn-helix domain-containing protein, partial [candidate division WOR-3 bacterium]
MFPQMGDRPFSFRLSAVQDHLNNGMSIAKTAVKWNVHPRTVYKWLKIYRIHGEFGLLSNYNRPWNRIERATEEKIAFLKERSKGTLVDKSIYVKIMPWVDLENWGAELVCSALKAFAFQASLRDVRVIGVKINGD